MNITLNTTMTKELVIDYRGNKTVTPPLFISRDCIERVTDFRFLGIHIEDDQTWSLNNCYH